MNRKFLFYLVLLSPSCFAQMNVGSFMSASSDKITTTYFYFAPPNDLTIIVNIVGFVQRPGRYEIASNIDLINLLSLAGGPTADGAINKVKITRILKEGERMHRKELYYDLEDLTAIKSEDMALAPGDVITIDRTTWSAFRDGLTVVISGAVVITTIASVIQVTKK